MTRFPISRRHFNAGLLGAAGLAMAPRLALAQETRSVTTTLGTYDIPADPQRVICIDARLDLEPAVALGLNVIGHGFGAPQSWVPANPDWVFVGEIVDLEQVLALDPDLIICTETADRDSEYWPINRLKDVAPLLPSPFEQSWQSALTTLAAWTGKDGEGDALIAQYEALIADIKTRHAAVIASKLVATVQPAEGSGVTLQTVEAFIHRQVLKDLGAKLIPAVEGNVVSAENFAEVLGAVDGVMVVRFSEDATDGLDQDPLWLRLPAVAAGKVVSPVGNVNYGGVYTAMHVAGLFDELFAKL